MLERWARSAIATGVGIAVAACSGGPHPSVAPAPARPSATQPTASPAAPVAAAPLPPIPHVTGALAITVVYPSSDAVIESRDSNFIFGSVGTGDATLTINGYSVPVQPNGAYLGWLPVPDSASSRYDLVAVAGSDTSRLSYPIRLMPSRQALADSEAIDDFRELEKPFPDSGHFVTLAARDTTVPDTDRYVIGRPVPGGTYKWFLLPGTLVEVTGRSPGFDRVRLDTALDVWVATTDIRTLAIYPPLPPLPPPPPVSDDAGKNGVHHLGRRASPAMPPRTTARVPATVLRPPPPPPPSTPPPSPPPTYSTPKGLEPAQPASEHIPPHRVVGIVRVAPAPDWVDVTFGIDDRPPYLVEENDNDLEVTFYGTQASTDLIQYVGRLGAEPGPPDTLVRDVTWEQVTSDRAVYTVHLSHAPFGYLVLWTPSGFVLRVRRPPRVDPALPLRGLTIAVDPGHPPAGSTGPTGLYEGVATLAIAEQLEKILIAHGAAVVMTRTTEGPVALTSRPVIARRANANAMVSIHLNALPDGMNPFTSHGTGTYFFHSQSIALAREVQAGLVATMGLRDLGVHYDNLAVVRPTWMPAVLCEGAFVIIPEQEAALRTPEFQARYAQGVADGLTAYFKGLAETTQVQHAPPLPTPVPNPVPAAVPKSGAAPS